MPSDPSPAATRRRWWRRGVRSVLWIFVALVILHIGERQLGEATWRRYREDAQRRGVKLRIADYVPPAVKDSENFAAIPVIGRAYNNTGAEESFFLPDPKIRKSQEKGGPFGNLVSVRDGMVVAHWIPTPSAEVAADVLQGMQRMEPELDQIRAAVSRPSARYPVNWQTGALGTDTSHLTTLQKAGKAFSTRACALLALHRSADALEDWRCIMRIQRSLEHEPTHICALVRMAVFSTGVAVVEKGIVADAWSDAELEAISDEVSKNDPLGALELSINSERAKYNDSYEAIAVWGSSSTKGEFDSRNDLTFAMFIMLDVLPRGYWRQNQVTYNKLADLQLEPSSAPGVAGRGDDNVSKEKERLSSGPILQYRSFLARMAFHGASSRFFRWHAQIGALRLSCALARYRHRHGDFPETIDTLVPEWIDAIPHDVMDGQPLRYRRSADGACEIWSVGDNRIDEGGKTDPKQKNFSKQPDWVWSIPAK
jgi:hypothetical protein